MNLDSKKSQSPLSQDYLVEIFGSLTHESIIARHHRSVLDQDIQNLLQTLEEMIDIKIPMRMTLREAIILLNQCLRENHPDSNPNADTQTFQTIYPVIKKLKFYFSNESDEKLKKLQTFKRFGPQ